MKYSKIVAVILIFVVAFGLVACGGKVKVKEKVSDEIVSAYAKKNSVKKSEVEYDCYGKFGNVYVLYFYKKELKVPNKLTVDGVTFKFLSEQEFDVYKEGKFYTLSAAFDKGWLSHSNLEKVLKNHKAANPQLYES